MKPETHYAVLSIDSLELALPQSDVATLESADRVDYSAGLPAQIETESGRWPVHCIGPDLARLDAVPAGRKICVVLHVAAGYAGILCDELRPLPASAARLHALPLAMQVPGTALLGLLIVGTVGYALTSARALLQPLQDSSPLLVAA